ncbi:MAG: phosphohistidine phosphatase SixA [Verrucomicrobia bacterium]|nr:MAG: phosphohistidine phosphatase SixA [Verrucomicrobiota bacterium]
MTLYILRHGLAGESGDPRYPRDSERPLTPKGKRKMGCIAEAMKRLDISLDIILSSPYVRARQTAEIVAKRFKARRRLSLLEALTPDGSPEELVEHINTLDVPHETVLLSGHEPYLSRFISVLIAGNPDLAIELKKGGLCKLEIETLRYDRCACIQWLLTPAQMTLMA